ncbi:MAG: heavy metal translocating P-type ATPase [Acidimicrobiales bacterium]
MSDACCDVGHDDGPAPSRLRDVSEIRAATVAGLALGTGLVAAWVGAGTISTISLAGALVVGGSTFVPQALRALARGRLSVGTLMAVAAIGAVALGELGEAATLAFLFSISEALESYALARTRHGLRALLDLVPAQATVLVDGQSQVVAAAELRPGDRLLVRPGERVATDGVIVVGRSALDLSAITGESVPVERGPGDEVYAATINGRAALEIEVTAATEDNSLARIVRIVEEAQDRKGASQRLAERIARPLVPGVVVVAGALAVGGSLLGDPGVWIARALVVLVAAAPCAFAISVPVTVVAAIGAATRSGVLIKGGAALEALGRVRTVALDKTGTLTENRPRVVEVVCAPGITSETVLGLAAALEARSEHPLAQAVLDAVGTAPAAARGVEAVAGSGLVGTVDGATVRLGRPGFVAAAGLSADVERMQAAGATVVLVERDGVTVGAIAVRDELRPEAAETIAVLHRAGMATAMLTGDNRATAEALGRRAGVGVVHSELLPTDKAAVIERLEASQPTAMVGDGINDAPALATATVGIAMGAMGTDVAIETADVALMGDDLRHLPDTLTHARRAGRIMRQNLALSGAILVILVPLAAVGALHLASVVAIHELAEVVVIANGVRASRRSAFADPGASPSPSETSDGAEPVLMSAGCTDGCCDSAATVTGPIVVRR